MKSRGVAAILALLLGGIGVHRFYLGKPDGLAYLLFCWTGIPLLIALIEGISFLCMSDEVFDDRYNAYYKAQYSPQYAGKQKSQYVPPKPDKSAISRAWYVKTAKRWILIAIGLAFAIQITYFVAQILNTPT